MDPAGAALAVPGKGLAGSVGRSSRRQITILERESWTRCVESLNASADPRNRRANLLVSGIALANTRGRVLRIGNVRVSIGGETTPCERMDEVIPGLRQAMRADWGGGVFGQVLDEGTIAVGDSVVWENSETRRTLTDNRGR
jgi:MOSC domain-containing protein YiiM